MRSLKATSHLIASDFLKALTHRDSLRLILAKFIVLRNSQLRNGPLNARCCIEMSLNHSDLRIIIVTYQPIDVDLCLKKYVLSS